MIDFISSTAGTSLTTLWFSVLSFWMGWDFLGTALAMNFVGFGVLAIGACIIGSLVWAARHVRIVII